MSYFHVSSLCCCSVCVSVRSSSALIKLGFLTSRQLINYTDSSFISRSPFFIFLPLSSVLYFSSRKSLSLSFSLDFCPYFLSFVPFLLSVFLLSVLPVSTPPSPHPCSSSSSSSSVVFFWVTSGEGGRRFGEILGNLILVAPHWRRGRRPAAVSNLTHLHHPPPLHPGLCLWNGVALLCSTETVPHFWFRVRQSFNPDCFATR